MKALRFSRMLFSRWLATLFFAGTAAAADPLVEITLGNGTVLRRQAEATPLGRAWSDPLVAALRARVDAEWPTWCTEFGTDPLVALSQMRQAGVRLSGDETPIVTMEALLGEQAAPVFAALAQGGEPLTVPGATAAAIHGKFQLQHQKSWVRGSTTKGLVPALGQSSTTHALSFTIQPTGSGKALGGWERFLSACQGTCDLTSTGLRTDVAIAGPMAGLSPISLEGLQGLPVCQELTLIGVNGPALWKSMVGPALSLTKTQHGVQETLKAIGVPFTIQTFIEGISGTWVVAITDARPVPGYTLIAPRSPTTDQLIEALAVKMGGAVPGEGQSLPLSWPFPVEVHLARNRNHWLMTSDPGLGSLWATGASKGWSGSALAQLLASKTNAQTLAASVYDTPRQFHQASMAMEKYMAQVEALSPSEKLAALALMQRLAALSVPGWSDLRRAGKGCAFTSEGLLPGVGFADWGNLLAAIAIPNPEESSITANETAVAATLKSGIFQAQVQFQAGAYLDQDQDGNGEFAPELALLAGKTTNQMRRALTLIAPPFNAPQPILKGQFLYALYSGPDAERQWVAYAWPATEKDGSKMFAISEGGVVYQQPFTGMSPGAMNLWGGERLPGNNVAADWKPYTKPSGQSGP